MSLSLEPPLIAIAPGKSSTSWPRIAPLGTFCANVLSEDQEALCRDFAISGADKADKFSGVGWSPGPGGSRRFSTVLSPGWSAGSCSPTTPATTSSWSPRCSTWGSTTRDVPSSSTGVASAASSPEPMPVVDLSAKIADVVVVTPDVHGDDRGRFVETYRRSWFTLGREMIQANRSDKQQGAVVGLHYHLHQADYWYVLQRHGPRRAPRPADRFADRRRDLVDGPRGRRGQGPVHTPGCRTRVRVVSPTCLLWYLVDGYYNPADELGCGVGRPRDRRRLGYRRHPVLSARDRANPLDVADRARQLRPRYGLRT